ncbi:hypothetical protein [Algoriphagus persicinus]|uniref:hypothetical protein n=1 Tax=Algoriphagus persicinus TaxID=3108754 RepID=UPI002B3C5396|nr:hypothetical protein [Algoriphagus sp. E1-3-M2]MEB2784601.1 hypothetical protein [Algoriphagus sp. E1-3-M2]
MRLPKNTHLQFFLFSAAVAGVVGLFCMLLPDIVHEKIWDIYFFMLIMSFLISVLNGFLLKSFAESFFNIMVLAMILRFVATIVFIGLAVWPGMENIILFIANFFVVFLFYLVFDIYTFLSNLRPISK